MVERSWSALAARLAVRAGLARVPGADAPIRRPLFILAPRTGTLRRTRSGAGPANQVLEYWSALSGLGVPRARPGANDPRFQAAAEGLRLHLRVDPACAPSTT
jgi:hypothetical protein